VLDEHVPYCIQHEPQQVVYPNPQNEEECVLKFRSTHKQHPLPFYLVCDFESFLTPLEREEEKERNSIKKLDVHSVSGFCCYRISSEAKYCIPPKVWSGPDPMTEFYDHVMEESRVISKIVSHQVPIRPMTSGVIRVVAGRVRGAAKVEWEARKIGAGCNALANKSVESEVPRRVARRPYGKARPEGPSRRGAVFVLRPAGPKVEARRAEAKFWVWLI